MSDIHITTQTTLLSPRYHHNSNPDLNLKLHLIWTLKPGFKPQTAWNKWRWAKMSKLSSSTVRKSKCFSQSLTTHILDQPTSQHMWSLFSFWIRWLHSMMTMNVGLLGGLSSSCLQEEKQSYFQENPNKQILPWCKITTEYLTSEKLKQLSRL